MEVVGVGTGVVKVSLDWQECALVARALRAFTPPSERADRQLGSMVPAFEALATLAFERWNLPPDAREALVAFGVPEALVL
jgi:hypothetical protein